MHFAFWRCKALCVYFKDMNCAHKKRIWDSLIRLIDKFWTSLSMTSFSATTCQLTVQLCGLVRSFFQVIWSSCRNSQTKKQTNRWLDTNSIWNELEIFSEYRKIFRLVLLCQIVIDMALIEIFKLTLCNY